MVFLAIRENADTDFRFHHLGRETFLVPVAWKDGWPVVNQTGKVELDVEADCLPPHPWPDEATRDDFDKTEPAMCWNFVRNPREEDWSLTDRPGWLRLNASPVTLADEGSPAVVGRRQRACRGRCMGQHAMSACR